MPSSRKRSMSTRGRYPKRARTLKRSRPSVGRSKWQKRGNEHYFKRWFDNGTITGNAVYAPYVATKTFALNQVPNVSEFSALFDQYQITKAVVKYYLKIDPSAQSASGASYPKIYYCRDLDTSAPPSTLDELRQRNNLVVRVLNPNKPVTFVLKPNVLGLIFQSGVSNQYEPRYNVWADMSDPSTIHYGFQWGIDDFTNTNYKLTSECILYFKCKNVR